MEILYWALPPWLGTDGGANGFADWLPAIAVPYNVKFFPRTDTRELPEQDAVANAATAKIKKSDMNLWYMDWRWFGW